MPSARIPASQVIIHGRSLSDIISQHAAWLAGDGGERANLRGANLADLSRSVFYAAIMTSCNLRESNLRAVDLSSALLLNSVFQEANLMAADFCGSVLEGARGLTGRQLSQAFTSYATILPGGSRGPYYAGKDFQSSGLLLTASPPQRNDPLAVIKNS